MRFADVCLEFKPFSFPCFSSFSCDVKQMFEQCYLFFVCTHIYIIIIMLLPVRIQIFLQLSGVEHFIAQHASLLQGGDVLAYTVVEFRVITAGKKVIHFLAGWLPVERCQMNGGLGRYMKRFRWSLSC